MSVMGHREGMLSVSCRLSSGRGSKNTGRYPASLSAIVAELLTTDSASSPMPCSAQERRQVQQDLHCGDSDGLTQRDGGRAAEVVVASALQHRRSLEDLLRI